MSTLTSGGDFLFNWDRSRSKTKGMQHALRRELEFSALQSNARQAISRARARPPYAASPERKIGEVSQLKSHRRNNYN